MPAARRIALLVNPKSANAESEVSVTAAEKAIRAGGQQPVLVHAGSEADFEPAFASLKQQQADALLTISDPLFTAQRNQIVALAARHAVAAIYPLREFADAGGFVSYGASSVDAFRQVGAYAARVLKGAKPADLPVVQPSRFELVINLKAAKALGLTITREFLLRADDVIE